MTRFFGLDRRSSLAAMIGGHGFAQDADSLNRCITLRMDVVSEIADFLLSRSAISIDSIHPLFTPVGLRRRWDSDSSMRYRS